MAKFEDELIARIRSGERISEIRKWFLTALTKEEIPFNELSPFEQAFFNQIIFAWEIWARRKEKRGQHDYVEQLMHASKMLDDIGST